MSPAALGLVALAVVFAILAVLYGVGAIHFLSSHSTGPSYKHAIALAVLAVLSLVGANFVRQRSATGA